MAPKRRMTEALLADGDAATPSKASPLDIATSPSSSAKKKMKPLVTTNSVTINGALKEKAERITSQLNHLYPNPPIPLYHETGFQLLCAVILSAQTTDLKVNECTPGLFSVAPDALSMSKLSSSEVEGHIRTLGLAPTKAKNLVGMSKMLVDLHSGQVRGPNSLGVTGPYLTLPLSH